MPTFPQLFGMSFMIIEIIYKFNPTPFALRAFVSSVGGGIRKAGFKGGVGVRLSLSDF